MEVLSIKDVITSACTVRVMGMHTTTESETFGGWKSEAERKWIATVSMQRCWIKRRRRPPAKQSRHDNHSRCSACPRRMQPHRITIVQCIVRLTDAQERDNMVRSGGLWMGLLADSSLTDGLNTQPSVRRPSMPATTRQS
jgi:hypothetical protein